MLQRVLAATLCVLGLVALGLAIASATLWRPADTLVASATAAEGHLLLTAPGVLDLAADDVTVEVTAPGSADVVLALGRTDDVLAWVGTDPALQVVGLADRETLATSTPDAEPAAPDADALEETADAEETSPPEETDAAGEGDEASEGGEGAEATEGTENTEATEAEDESAGVTADPRGSDLWVEEVRGSGSASLQWTAEPGRWSVLAAAPGSAVAPTITMTWPQEVLTPFLVPGVVVGAVLLLVGLGWLVLQFLSRRAEARAVRTDPAGEAAAPDPASASPATARPAVPFASPASAVPTGSPPPGVPESPAPQAEARTGPDRPLTRREIRLREQEAERQGRRGRRDPGAADAATTDTGPVAAQGPSGPAAPGHRPAGPGAWVAGNNDPAGRPANVSGEAWRRAWGLGTAPGDEERRADDPQAGTRPPGRTHDGEDR